MAQQPATTHLAPDMSGMELINTKLCIFHSSTNRVLGAQLIKTKRQTDKAELKIPFLQSGNRS